jgi:hypothetical protein
MAVYTDIAMARKTQITLTDRQHALLTEESVRTGLSMAELVRRAIDATYRPHLRPVVGGFHLNFGATRGPDAAVVARLAGAPRRVRD